MSTYGRPQLVFPRLTPTVKSLLIALFAIYVAQLVLDGWIGLGLGELLALRPGGAGLWQLISYVVVDLGHPIWFLLGLVFLWFALSPFEESFGPRRTMQLCVTVALGASIPAYLMGFAAPISPPLFGTSPIWFGGFTARLWLFREQPMMLIGLPPMEGKRLLMILVGLIFLIFLFDKNHTNFVGDLGAMAAGIGFVRWMARPRRVPSVKKRKGDEARARGLRVIDGGGESDDDQERPKWLN